MIGDWAKITRSCDVPMNSNINVDLTDITDLECGIIDLEPIPLTPEILEKNGFIQCGEDSLYPQYNDCTYRFSDNRGHVIILEYIGWSHGYYNVHDITTIHDVHELQHIFKIKKIKKEIIL